MSDLTTYAYEAIAVDGTRVKQTRTAASVEVLARVLASEGYTLLSVEERAPTVLNADIGAMFGGGQPTMKVGELAVFAQSMAQMLDAGLPVSRALEVTASEAHPRYRQALLDVRESVLQGTRLSEAFAAFPGCFDEVFVGYVEVGEESGELARAFGQLAGQTKQQNEVKIKIKGVTAYPKMVGGAIGLMVLVILKFVVPQFAGIYASLGSDLPAPTKAVVSLSNLLNPIGTFNLPVVTLTLLSPFVFVPIAIAMRVFYKRARAGFRDSFVTNPVDDALVRKQWIVKSLLLLGAIVGWNLFIAFGYNNVIGAALYPDMLLPIDDPAYPGPSSLLAAVVFQKPFQVTLLSPVSWLAVYLFYRLITDYLSFMASNAYCLRKLNWVSFHIPIFGKLNYQMSLYRTTSTLAGAMSSGLQFTRALRLAGTASGSALFSESCERVSYNVEGGAKVADSMDRFPELFPASVRAMVHAGEESGDMPPLLVKGAETVDKQIEATVASLGARIEVGLLVLMGAVVGGLVVVLYLPIFSLATAATQNI